MRYSKTLPDKYLSSTAVVCSECLKFITSILFHVIQRVREIKPPEKYSFKMLLNELFGNESDCIKVMVPAVLYLIQNNLQYFSASKLDAATYQVSYQMKIVTTAIFSVIILGRKLFKHQWISVILLTVGIALVQFPTGDSGSKNSENAMGDKIIGLVGVIIACILSGCAGVYFEKILKKSKVTLWARNVQLSLFSIIPGYFIGVLILDGETLKEKGFFGGYTRWTVLAILFQAFGGILVAVVVKYADNILKGFATSISIILSCIISYFAFDFNVTMLFIIGSSIVMYATYLYGKPVKQENEVSYARLEEGQDLEDIEIEQLNNDEN
jgi:UDP-sugar transporter A1/2/3